MATQRIRYLIKLAALTGALFIGACDPSATTGDGGFVDTIKGALERTAENLRNRLSADYDPPDYDGPTLGELPVYYLGDAFTYSSGRTETIERLEDDLVVWRNDLKASYERRRNFVLPTVRTRTDRGEVYRTFDVGSDVLWPLIPGTRRQFASKVRVRIEGDRGERLFIRDWICTVNGLERVSVRIGEFESVKISCDRFGRGRWRQTRTWYFVPEIGHFVKRVDTYSSRDKREVELVSVRQAHKDLNSAARRSLYEMEQRTLERLPSGKSASWRAPGGRLQVKMTVTRTMRTEAGQFCRTFRIEILNGGDKRLVPGLSCRTWNGRWVRL